MLIILIILDLLLTTFNLHTLILVSFIVFLNLLLLLQDPNLVPE
jgi:hypothetical protein